MASLGMMSHTTSQQRQSGNLKQVGHPQIMNVNESLR